MPWFVIDMLNIIMELALCQLFFTRFLDGFRSRPVIWAPVYLISFAAMSVCALFSVHSLVQLTVTVSTTFLIALTLFKDRLWKRLFFVLCVYCRNAGVHDADALVRRQCRSAGNAKVYRYDSDQAVYVLDNCLHLVCNAAQDKQTAA